MKTTDQFEVVHRGKHDDKWLALRRDLGIGASESPAILGVSCFSSAYAVYASKLDLVEPVKETEAMRWGNILEDHVISEFARDTDRAVTIWGHTLRSLRWPFLIATPDAKESASFTIETKPRPGKLEVFLPFRCVQVKVTSRGDLWRENIPPEVWVQVQHEMAVTGFTSATAVALVGGTSLVWQDVARDDKFIEENLVPVCEAFWRVVQARESYDVIDASDATSSVLKMMYPDDDGRTVDLEARFIALHDEREQLKREDKKLSERLQKIDSEFRNAIGDATFAALPNGIIYSLKSQKRTQKPRTIEECKTSTFRVLRVVGERRK